MIRGILLSKRDEFVSDTFDAYLRDLREFAKAEKTEHTDRGALEKLLKAFAAQANGKPKVQHEPKRIADKGAPDFKVVKSGMILGYVENKAIGENLTKVLKSDQIAKYKTLSPNIILTDYLEFAWISKDGIKRETLCHDTDLESRKFKLNPERVAAVAALIEGFFSTAPEGIGTSKPLAEALAARSKLLRDYLGEELVRQEREHQEGRLFGLYKTFRDQVFHELTLKEFADAFAQMLAYGLFLARLNADEKVLITLSNARDHIPGSFQLIHELVEFLTELNKTEYQEIRWVVEEVLSIVNGLDLAAIHEDLSFRQRKAINRKVRAQDEEEHRLFERDPFIYFYEDYLKAYDKETRKGRGVYYTPPPVVNFIVRAIDDILKDSFGIKSGLADNKRVTVLDFACGTGTFLLEVFQQIFENIGGADSAVAKKVVSEHILQNLYGFEYLIAPYTIAHLKLSQYLRDKGHPLKDNERLQVFLTNTLEPIHPEPNFLLPAITQESEAAQKVKDKPILVITGNPPYSGHSKNKGEWITAQIAKYREGFPELSKPAQGKWLQDDYVKFIRFAQLKMEAVPEGVVGIITNHSWLDNPTFKGMRKSLMATFDQVYVIDLHGSTKKKERSPNGEKDENVFDIEQGVAISIFIKKANVEKGVWHSDLWGKQIAKYQAAALGTKSAVDWAKVEPGAPDWMFKPQDTDLGVKYREFWSVPAIFGRLGDPAPGIVTTHDEFAISFSESEAKGKVQTLLATSDEQQARKMFRLCSQAQWDYETAKSELPKIDLDSAATELCYRPFDSRWTIWDRNVAVHRRERVMRHMLSGNVAITTSRQAGAIGSPEFDAVMAVNRPVDFNFYRRGGEYVFPAYIAAENANRSESYSSSFRAFIDARYDSQYTPEEILGYIYAVLHTPTYRVRYAEFLRQDFPRIPFSEKAEDFEALSEFGWELVQAHLLKEYPYAGLAKYHGKGDDAVEAVRYSEAEQAIWINKAQCFKPVPEDVWNFHIGGYQVLEKYLKSRKGRQLSLDEINHVAAVADSLAFTITQMAKIDEAYKKAFPDRG
jgi:predicted helicase